VPIKSTTITEGRKKGEKRKRKKEKKIEVKT